MRITKNRPSNAYLAFIGVCLAPLVGGCENAGQGAVSGGAIGALGGLTIGSLSGNAGRGATIGAVTGAIAGGVMGDQNERARAEQTQMRSGGRGSQSVNAMPEPPIIQRPAEPPPRRPAMGSAMSPADSDRAALARFVGVWDFTGWAAQPGGSQVQGAGRAAASIENEYFVLMDIQRTSGELAERTSRKSGSLLLASEPGVGLTLTAWGDASPSISRLVGQVRQDGSVITFQESKTPANMRRISVTMTFEADGRWVAEIHDASASGQPVIASYTFTRRWQ